MQLEELNKMSEQIPSQGSPSDPDDAWDRAQEKYDTAFDNLLDQLGDIGIGVGEAFNVNVDPEEISYEEIEDIYDNANDTEEIEQWNEMLNIANEPDPGKSYSDMIWEAERKKSQYPRGKGFRMKMTDTDEWLRKKKRVSE